MNARDCTTAFLPLNYEIGGQVSHGRPNVGQYLTREQADFIYKKVQTGKMINADTIPQEIE